MDQDRPQAAARVSAQQLLSFTAAVLAAVGVPAADASLVADSLVTADLWGHQSHGVLRLSWYVNRIQAGVMHPVTVPETVSDTGALAVVVDGHDGVGQVLAAFAAREAAAAPASTASGSWRCATPTTSARPRTSPAWPPATAASRCSPQRQPGHGPLGRPAQDRRHQPVVDRGLGRQARRHGHGHPNTAVARGKVYLARQRGEPIPAGWAIDADGAPTPTPRPPSPG